MEYLDQKQTCVVFNACLSIYILLAVPVNDMTEVSIHGYNVAHDNVTV